MKFAARICCFFLFLAPAASGQKLAVKTNLAYAATGTINLGGEVALGRRTTLDLTWGYNPWTFADNKKWKHWLVMPEARYYLCESFNGHFFGIHAGFCNYNVGGIPLLYYHDARYYHYEGWAAGAGISYGYQWILGGRWNMEATVGYGLIYTEYNKFIQDNCGPLLGKFQNMFASPTKVGITLVYMIR